jgi:glyoxylase-like metal-dependent hydrolase (beta-lactamase superfamily II)
MIASVTGSTGLQYPCGEPPAIGQSREIAPHVHWVRLPMPYALDHVNSWVLAADGDVVIVDTGLGNDRSAQCWESLLGSKWPLESRSRLSVCVTHLHPDHIGMAGDLIRKHGGKLWMTSKEHDAAVSAVAKARGGDPSRVEFLLRAGWTMEEASKGGHLASGFATSVTGIPAAHKRLRDGSKFHAAGVEWEVITGSGHSPDHACLYSQENRMLISGDQVLPRISSNVSVFGDAPDADPLGDWLASIEKFRARVPPDTLVLPAHNEPFRGLHARLDQLEQEQHQALDRLRTALCESISAIEAITPIFRRAITSGLQFEMATGESIACLNYLLHRDEIEVHEDAAGIARYQIRGDSHSR